VIFYAAAGANTPRGGEGKDEYKEPHAGVIYFDYDKGGFFFPGYRGCR